MSSLPPSSTNETEKSKDKETNYNNTPWLFETLEYQDLLSRRNKRTSKGWKDPPLSIQKINLSELKLSDNSMSLKKKLQSLQNESFTESYRRL